MRIRADQGIRIPDNLEITVSLDEIELKLESICASAFRSLKTQLEEKRDTFISIVTAAEFIESGSDYYSTQVLQKKLAEKCRIALNKLNLDFPLRHIEAERKNEYDSVLREIDSKYGVIKESVKSNLIAIKKSASSIEQKKPPLKMHVDAFKSDLISALQDAAEECCKLMASKGWSNKIEEFTDIFGCVVRVFGSSPPYELDKRFGYGLNFGQKLRNAGKLPKTFPNISSIKSMKLEDIEQMIQQVIIECQAYPKLSYEFLKIIKSHLEKLSKGKEYQGYIAFKDTGTFYTYLSSISLRKEKNIVDEPLALLRKQHEELERKCDGAVAQQIQEFLKPLQVAVETYRHNTEKTIAFINTEARNAADDLHVNSLAHCNDVGSSISSMQFINSEAETLSLATHTASNTVKLAYQDAMKFAKARDEKKFAGQVAWAAESLDLAKAKMLELEPKLLSLNSHRVSIAKKLTMAKEFDGAMYRTLQASYKREVAKYEELKSINVFMEKAYSDANIFPRAIKVYGDLHYDGANAKLNIDEASGYLKIIPAAFQALKENFNNLIDDLKDNKECKLEHYQQKGELELAKAGDALRKGAENIALANKYKDEAIVKLTKAEEVFPIHIHVEHQESISVLGMRFAEIKKQQTIQESNLAFMQLLPDAMKDYSSIVINTVKIQEDSKFVTHSCNQLSANVKAIRDAKLEVESLARAGVVKQNLEEFAQVKLKEMAQVLDVAQKTLKKADQIRLEEQKALLQAKHKYPEEIHSKPQDLFDKTNNQYALALTNYNAAFKSYMDISVEVELLREQLISGKQVEHEKQQATEMRQFLLKTIFMNFDLWKPNSRWGGGVNYRYGSVDYCIPNGVFEIIMALTNSTDHNQCIDKVVNVSTTRDLLASKWKYHLFHIRNEKTGQLYKILKDHLKSGNIQVLQDALKDIHGIKIPTKELEVIKISDIKTPKPELEEKRQDLVSSI